MATNSKIEWTTHTFNPWIGCTEVSPGCAHCYARDMMERRYHRVQWGAGQPRSRTTADYWKQPARWQRQAQANGQRERVFCASLADWLDDEVPIDWLADLLKLIETTPHLDWLLLTKRLEHWSDRLQAVSRLTHDDATIASTWLEGNAPVNVWLGTTVENQAQAERRVPRLLALPATLCFLSCEPLLEAINLLPYLSTVADANGTCALESNRLHWIICGGESGKEARSFDLQWARSLREQCQTAGVAFFFKQTGAHAIDSSQSHPVRRSLQDPKGGNITTLPEDLQVREIPTLLQPAPVERSKKQKCVPLPIKEVL
ncbi:phage Gp37/Gp68 family protein [Leptolyngbya sp. FACHB-321]|uniref:phage Gp37/Gp68 family protein n=1 Tax=Leptolyngbya sp. FACHB-321 TaxID=2692807 RepID=UPI001686EFA4|nr:phage Gp37/Gp68 family protein [Leptolyngbya sp. FACHB-321]MBD2033820.1 phage Gp37/Gp68 family protein [Leptolyngbya sp. FACHB-321]